MINGATNLKQDNTAQEMGFVVSSRSYLAQLNGLPSVKVNDIVQNEKGMRGMVNTLMPTYIEVLLLDEGSVTPGETFTKTGQNISVTVGDFLLGRSITPLGLPIDGKGMLSKDTAEAHSLEQAARGIEAREFITEQLITGITLVDNLIPIGKGQRELIIGDSHAGIPNFLIDIIVNQKDSGVICIYAAIGKPSTSIKNLINTLQVNNALPHTIIVASSSTEPAPLILLTPKTALTVAEYFQKQGKDVLVILDDMGIHAKLYREISLLANKSPGRESFPGDIFYQQARLMERAGRFNNNFGSGSITALPVIELNLNDFTGFIPTNLMSITDGHLLFKANLYNKNQRPAIDTALSVSRVGRQTQRLVNSLLSRRVRQVLGKAEELETISRFSAELPEETQLVLRQKDMINEILRQDDLTSMPLDIQTILLSLIFTSFLKGKNDAFIKKNKQSLINAFLKDPNLVKITQSIASFKTDEDLIKALEKVVI